MGILASINAVGRFLSRVAARVRGFVREPAEAGGRNRAAETLEWLRERFAEDIKANFTESHDPDGNPWKPLKWRIGKPLILTGLLMNSAYLAAQNVQLRGTEIMASLLQPGYWQYHEFGTSRIPARPFFGPSGDTVRGLADRMARDMADALQEDAGR